MPQGDKRHYTDKQRRKAEHIMDSFLEQGYPKKQAEARAWATVNAIHGGGERKGGSGYGKPENKAVYRKGAKKAAKRPGRTGARSHRTARRTVSPAARRAR